MHLIVFIGAHHHVQSVANGVPIISAMGHDRIVAEFPGVISIYNVHSIFGGNVYLDIMHMYRM